MKFVRVIIDSRLENDQAAQVFKKRVESAPLYCKIHPDNETILLIAPDREQLISVEKNCCSEFLQELKERGLII